MNLFFILNLFLKKKIEFLTEENQKWKLLNEEQLKRISALEYDLTVSKRRISELENQLREDALQKEEIVQSKINLQNKYDKLKQRLVQLQDLKEVSFFLLQNSNYFHYRM